MNLELFIEKWNEKDTTLYISVTHRGLIEYEDIYKLTENTNYGHIAAVIAGLIDSYGIAENRIYWDGYNQEFGELTKSEMEYYMRKIEESL